MACRAARGARLDDDIGVGEDAVMSWIPCATLMAAAYLVGSIPFAFLIGRCRGVDIRAVGSGNVGATNVARTLGLGWGVATFLLDAAKGWLPAALGPSLCERWSGVAPPPALGLAFGVAAVMGHAWPVWLRFRGGKGVATTAGVLVGIAPAAAAVGLGVWVVAAAGTRYVSVGSMAAALTVPIAAWALYGRTDAWRPWLLTGLGALIIWRHRSNIARLLAGTEPAWGRPRGDGEPAKPA